MYCLSVLYLSLTISQFILPSNWNKLNLYKLYWVISNKPVIVLYIAFFIVLVDLGKYKFIKQKQRIFHTWNSGYSRTGLYWVKKINVRCVDRIWIFDEKKWQKSQKKIFSTIFHLVAAILTLKTWKSVRNTFCAL